MERMTDKVYGKKPSGDVRQVVIPPQRNVKKGENSFGEVLKSTKEKTDKTKEKSSSLPEFPYAKARVKTITLAQANRIAQLAPIIQDAAKRHNVPVELICGIIIQESGGNARAVSKTGAKGLMQLMNGTARRFGVSNSFNPTQNIEGGTKYLKWLLDRFNGNVELTVAAYNAGEGNVEKHGMKVPPFRETQDYVPNVLGYCVAMIEILSQPAAPAPIVATREKVG